MLLGEDRLIVPRPACTGREDESVECLGVGVSSYSHAY